MHLGSQHFPYFLDKAKAPDIGPHCQTMDMSFLYSEEPDWPGCPLCHCPSIPSQHPSWKALGRVSVHGPAPLRSPRAARQGPAFLRDDIGARKNKYIFLAAPLPLFVPWKEKVFLLEMLSLSAWTDQQSWEQCVLPLSHQFPSSHHFSHWKRLFPNSWTPRYPSHSQPGALPEALSCQRATDHLAPAQTLLSSNSKLHGHSQLRTMGWVFMEKGAYLSSTLPHIYSTFSCFLGCFQLLDYPLSYPQSPLVHGEGTGSVGMGFSSLVGKAQACWGNWGQEQSWGFPVDLHSPSQRAQEQLLWAPTALHML